MCWLLSQYVAQAACRRRPQHFGWHARMTDQNNDIRVLVVDDHPIMREGIRSVLTYASGITVVGEAADGQSAVNQVRALRPDVTLMDLQMPNMGGVEAIEIIREEFPGSAIVVLSTFSTDVQAVRALRAGARGYLLKDSLSSDLINTIRAVHAGRRYVTGVIADEIAAHVEIDTLTEREIAVLKVVSGGNTNRDVANKLDISLDTVKQHMKNIASKLGTRDRAHAVTIAIKRGIIDP